ncbi:VanZ family protein [Polaribacter butkevichii]
MPKLKESFNNIDKVYHLSAYFALSICWLFSFYKKKSLKYVIVISCIIFGIIIEVLQATLTVYRTGDYKDVLANTLGILLGLFVFNQILKKITVNSY